MLQTLFNTSVSTTTLYGTVVTDIQVEKHQKSFEVTRFSILVSVNKSDRRQFESKPYVRAFAYGANAQFIKEKVKVGAPIFVRGKFVRRTKCHPDGRQTNTSEFEIRDVAVIG